MHDGLYLEMKNMGKGRKRAVYLNHLFYLGLKTTD